MKLTVQTNQDRPGLTKVFLDDQEISSAIQGMTLDFQTGSIPRATMDLRIYNITEIQDTDHRHLLPFQTQELLKKMGWTPPAGEPTETFFTKLAANGDS